MHFMLLTRDALKSQTSMEIFWRRLYAQVFVVFIYLSKMHRSYLELKVSNKVLFLKSESCWVDKILWPSHVIIGLIFLTIRVPVIWLGVYTISQNSLFRLSVTLSWNQTAPQSLPPQTRCLCKPLRYPWIYEHFSQNWILYFQKLYLTGSS